MNNLIHIQDINKPSHDSKMHRSLYEWKRHLLVILVLIYQAFKSFKTIVKLDYLIIFLWPNTLLPLTQYITATKMADISLYFLRYSFHHTSVLSTINHSERSKDIKKKHITKTIIIIIVCNNNSLLKEIQVVVSSSIATCIQLSVSCYRPKSVITQLNLNWHTPYSIMYLKRLDQAFIYYQILILYCAALWCATVRRLKPYMRALEAMPDTLST